MPIFDYYCKIDQNIKYDVFYTSEEDTPVCPDCEKPMEKLMGTPRAIFKSSGFYETDYKDKNKTHNNKLTKEDRERYAENPNVTILDDKPEPDDEGSFTMEKKTYRKDD